MCSGVKLRCINFYKENILCINEKYVLRYSATLRKLSPHVYNTADNFPTPYICTIIPRFLYFRPTRRTRIISDDVLSTSARGRIYPGISREDGVIGCMDYFDDYSVSLSMGAPISFRMTELIRKLT